MGSDDALDHCTLSEIVGSGEVDAGSNNIDSLEVLSSGRQTNYELERTAENLTQVELDLACCSEKLVNLDILVMHVASRENDFEAFASSGKEQSEVAHVDKALEFDFLFVFLCCEIEELESYLCLLESEIASSSEFVSSLEHLSDDSMKYMQEKIQDCEDSLQRSFKQVSDVVMQCNEFRRILSASSGGADEKEFAGFENGEHPNSNAEIKMQTAEQQRNVLRMLEKSLAREINLEKKLTESRQTVEDLELRLQQEVYAMEQETDDLLERLMDAENTKEILFGISKELLSKAADAEKRAIEKADQLEAQLKNTEIQRRNAVASAEASQEKQNMSECVIRDMDILIKNLKSRILKAETETKIAEEKRILLSEANAELTEEANALRQRVKNLENSLDQTDEAKNRSGKAIKLQAMQIADLVLKLSNERKRLHKEVLCLRKEKKKQTTLQSENAAGSAIGTVSVEVVRDIGARQLRCKRVMRIVVLVSIIPSFLLLYYLGENFSGP